MVTQFYLDATKTTEHCIPALKAIAPTVPDYGTPTTVTMTSEALGLACGALTATTGGVPGRLNPATGTNSNSSCTAAGAPAACCEGMGTGHCDEGLTVTCGSLTSGGGGPTVGNPGDEGGSATGRRTRYNIACGSPDDTSCAISGNTGDLPNGINCTTTGCGGVTPVETTTPVKVCALNTLAAPGATGNLNLVSGEISLTTTTNATVHILTSTSFPDTACPRCRTGTATTDPEVFRTGPSTPGIGVCDDDAVNTGDPCIVFEPAGTTAGMTTDCEPDVSGGATAVVSIGTTQTTAGTSISDPAGHFCPGQAGNADCTGPGTPQICCSGVGMGSCNNHNGCFGSANASGTRYADTPGICTGIAVSGTAPGLLIKGTTSDVATYGTVACIPAVNAGVALSDLVNNNAGLPGPMVTSSKVRFEVN